MFKTLLFLVFLSACSCLSAQTPATLVAKSTVGLSDDYADEAVVIERQDVVYRFTADGLGSRVDTWVVRVQSAAALQAFGVLSVPYASGSQRLEINYVRVRKPDGTVVTTPADDAQDQPAPVTQVAPMYSDLHLKQIPVRSLAVGDKLEFETRNVQLKAEVPGEFWGQDNFGAGAVILERTIELRVPKTKHVEVYSPEHSAEIAEAGDERVYRWKGAQLRGSAAKSDDDAPKDNKPPIAWTTFASWEAVGLWYRGVIAGRDAVTPAIQAKADELTANAKTDTEKVQALYNYVALHNHYIGIDFGIGRFQPHTAAEVMTNQYGDCKDKHTLLAALLRAKGFPVSAVLIGVGIDMNETMPMPAAFNHLITLVKVGGEDVWLDATTEVAPYRVLMAVIRDKQALVVPEVGAPMLRKTPAELPFAAVDRYEAKAELDKTGSLKGHVDMSSRGDSEVMGRMVARQVPRAQWDQISANIPLMNGIGATTSATILDVAEGTSGPWHMSFDFTKSLYGDWPNYRIGALIPNLSLPSIDEKKPPKREIELGGPRTDIAIGTIHLPVGYSAELPDAVHVKAAFATFDKTYQMKDGSLIAERRLEVLQAKVPASDWAVYKKFIDDAGVEPWIQLTATEHANGESRPPLAGQINATAAALVQQAEVALKAKDKVLGREKLERAKVLNDKQKYLWSQLGYLAFLDEKYDEAVDDYETELKLNPDCTSLYPFLINAEDKAGKKEEAHKSLLAYAEAAPKKDTAILYVGNHLLSMDKVSDAVDVYRAGAKAIPENKLIQVELASALMRAGKQDEAVAVDKAAMEGSTDADVLNDGAYVLASHNVEMPLAQSSSRKEVELLEAESSQAVLESVNTRSFRRTNLLLASWDTLGWIYFADGKMDLAEQYIRAAWNNAGHAEMGLHLGQILEKKGETTQAMAVYEMALVGTKGASATPVSDDLHARMEGLKKAGVGVQNPHPDAALQERRTFHVPRLENAKGSAILLFQVSAVKTEKVIFSSGDAALRPMIEAVAHVDLGLAVPKDSHALLLRSGVLFCSTQSACEFVLTPPESANVK